MPYNPLRPTLDARMQLLEEPVPVSFRPVMDVRAIAVDANGAPADLGAGYLTIAAAAASYQPLDTDLLNVTWAVEDPAPVDETRFFSIYATFAGTIDAVTHKLASGTCTLAIRINGTPVTGLSAVSVTSSKATATASGANTVAIGDELTYVISASSTPVGLSLAIRATR